MGKKIRTPPADSQTFMHTFHRGRPGVWIWECQVHATRCKPIFSTLQQFFLKIVDKTLSQEAHGHSAP